MTTPAVLRTTPSGGQHLRPSRDGWCIPYRSQGRQVVDRPFAETKKLVAGYTLIQVRSREEALEWRRRFPNPVRESAEAVIEVRPLYERSDFQPPATTVPH